jgi:hypothetical protein
MLDFIVSFGIGRPMTIRPGTISQHLPYSGDFNAQETSNEPFIYLCRFLLGLASVADLMNDGRVHEINDLARSKSVLVELHQTLPKEMMWTSNK